ncbi:2-dehydropantoate 2-reductase family protein [Rhizodiscina lignyota]|uniref:2-dehydropantoate 2-reductase n=1 Tax=Rhizodiscina lignyota TaxID=1504668 RepID=A0A9P4ID99_9PEZI|nr:2-dehydropantoate 2-reductase family protein [Rhizodiscina lignyota]
MGEKKNVLLVGGGGVGAIGALNLEAGGLAAVTAVLRSNYQVVKDDGFEIHSCDHGVLKGWRPTQVVSKVPNVKEENLPAFDYIVCATKNIPDVPPTVVDIISPAVTPSHTVIVLIQNGLNIEKPIFAAFPQNIVLSGVSMIGSNETKLGFIQHDEVDEIIISAFENPNLETAVQVAAAEDFVRAYSAAGKCKCSHDANVGFVRWRKLVYNACINPVSAITDLDSGRLQIADGAADTLLRPAMEEIRAAAKVFGHDLPAEVIQKTITVDPVDMYLPPSMLGDVRKGNFIEFENLLGEPLRDGTAKGVPMPTLTVLYNLCKAIQWRNKQLKGLIEIPPKKDYTTSPH